MYTYFTWRNSKHELEAYAREVTTPPVSDFSFGPNFWPSTPDILPFMLQSGDQAVFVSRVILRRDALGELRHLRTSVRKSHTRAAAHGHGRISRIQEKYENQRRGRRTRRCDRCCVY